MYHTHIQMHVCVKIYMYIYKNIHQKKQVKRRYIRHALILQQSNRRQLYSLFCIFYFICIA